MKTGKKSTSVRRAAIEHQGRGIFLYPQISSCPHWLHLSFDTHSIYSYCVFLCDILVYLWTAYVCVDILQRMMKHERCKHEIMPKFVVYLWIIILMWFIERIEITNVSLKCLFGPQSNWLSTRSVFLYPPNVWPFDEWLCLFTPQICFIFKWGGDHKEEEEKGQQVPLVIWRRQGEKEKEGEKPEEEN